MTAQSTAVDASGTTGSGRSRDSVLPSDLDAALTDQLVVAWAGEGGDEPRLGWWRTELATEYGGEDLFRRLLPATWRWAVLQGAREAARRQDAELRRRDHDPDSLISLFHLGFDMDEQLEQRLTLLKTSGQAPITVLPGLADIVEAPFERQAFEDWVSGHESVRTRVVPEGRRLGGTPPADLRGRMRRLVAALAPLPDAYPLPHYRRDA